MQKTSYALLRYIKNKLKLMLLDNVSQANKITELSYGGSNTIKSAQKSMMYLVTWSIGVTFADVRSSGVRMGSPKTKTKNVICD